MSNGEVVRVEIDGSVQTIRLDRPETMNALTAAMFDAVSDALVLGEGDGKIRVFILTGMPGSFTGGSDTSEYEEYVQGGAITYQNEGFAQSRGLLATNGVIHTEAIMRLASL